LAGLPACDSAEVKACHADMQASQQALLEMDKTDPGSVEATLGHIERTLGTCKQAGRGEEVANLADAKRQVAAHLDALEKRANRPTRAELTPEALAALLTRARDAARGPLTVAAALPVVRSLQEASLAIDRRARGGPMSH